MSRDLVSGLIKIHVLYHAAREPVFGLAMIRELQRHGYKVSPGTLYPMLHGMEAAGLLKSEERAVQGRRRKYYRATPEGHAALAEIRPMIVELAEEVVDGHGPETIGLGGEEAADEP